MAKRKEITGLDELLGGKQGATGDKIRVTNNQARSGVTLKTRGKPAAAARTDQLVKPKRSATAIKQEYQRYGKPISFRLPIKLDVEIERIAKAEGVGKTDLVRYLLDHFTKEYKRGSWPLKKQAKTYKLT